MVAVSYLNSLQQRQRELIEDNKKRKPLPFLLRRQEVALNQWDQFQLAFSFSQLAKIFHSQTNQTEQLKQI